MLLTWRHVAGVSTFTAAICVATAQWPDHPRLVAFGALILFFSGVLPTAYFPPFFSFAYTFYTSRWGKCLKDILHPRANIPHSNFRPGCRVLGLNQPIQQPHHEYDIGLRALRTSGDLKLFIDACKSNDDTAVDVVVVPVPIFADNYSYLCLSRSTKSAVAIDPADPFTVLQMIELMRQEAGVNFELTEVLCTHHHWDHAGGNAHLLQLARWRQREKENQTANNFAGLVPQESADKLSKFVCPTLRIFGSSIDQPDGITDAIGDVPHSIRCGRGSIVAQPIPSPGHTKGSLMFLVTETFGTSTALHVSSDVAGRSMIPPHRGALFTGDCIFCGGCGAMFELRSVSDVLQTYDALHNDMLVCTSPGGAVPIDPANVAVFVGHEYSEKLLNELRTTATTRKWPSIIVDHLDAELRRVNALRKLQKSGDTTFLPFCTTPSTLHIERIVNPLLNLKREALVKLSRKQSRANFFSGDPDVESLIYLSDDRDSK